MRLQRRAGAGCRELHRQQVQAGHPATTAFISKGVTDLPQACVRVGCGENAARHNGVGKDSLEVEKF